MIKVRLLLVLMLLALLGACSDEENTSKTIEEDVADEYYIPTDGDATKLCEDIFDCVLNEDNEALIEMFSPAIQEKCDLQSQIEEAFEFIDGNILEYDAPIGNTGGGEFVEGKRVKMKLGGSVLNFSTDSGKNYKLSFGSYAIYDDNTDLIGVTSIRITCRDDYVEGVGYPTYCVIGKEGAD